MKTFRYAKLLKDVSQEDLSSAGVKGANLGEMLKAGLPVPGGFVLLAESCKCFVKANKIDIEIENFLNEVDEDPHKNTEEAYLKIQKMFINGDIPSDVLGDIDTAYEAIGNPAAAVRSSAAAEDLPGASFAGQYDTYLNVKGKDELHHYVKKCWASLWNSRGLSYRTKQNIDITGLGHGVVVQKLIHAEKSGVLFTANPINGRRDQMLLNASWGLGKAIVDGEVTPDQWVVDKKNRRIVSACISSKEVMTVVNESAAENVAVPEDKRKAATLDQEDVLKLLELGEAVEKLFGSPQDIEWVFSETVFYLVQSRSITTLYPMPKPDEAGRGLRIYVNFLMNKQAMHEPLTPMGEDLIRSAFLSIVFNRKNRVKPVRWLKSAAGRLYVDVTEFYRFEKWFDKLRNNSSDMDPVTTRAMLQVLERDKAELSKQGKSLIPSALKMFVKMNPRLLSFMVSSLPKVIYGMVFSPEKAVAKAFEYGHHQIETIKVKRERLQTRQEKMDFIEREFTNFFYYVPLEVLYYVTISFTYLEKARKIINKHAGNTTLLNTVKKAMPNNVTTEMGMALLKAAKSIFEAGECPTPDNLKITEFLSEYGNRSNQEVDLGVPRWKEAPEYVVDLVQSYIDNQSFNEGIDGFYKDAEEAEQAIEAMISQLKEKEAYRDARKVERLLKKFRIMFGVRELPKFILTNAFSLLREVLMEIGDELQLEERLDHKRDIFFVRFEDIQSEAKLQKIAKQNQEAYQRELQRSAVPRVMTSTGETVFFAADDEMDHTFRGIPVSPGVYEGPVKVLKCPEEGKRLKQGDILVTTSTSPAWTPLFLMIGGLITETGGPISHGSVVAREYGVPAVAGVREASTRLMDGQIVRLNGETGSLEILS
jgi:pyruvate,water dikinase